MSTAFKKMEIIKTAIVASLVEKILFKKLLKEELTVVKSFPTREDTSHIASQGEKVQTKKIF